MARGREHDGEDQHGIGPVYEVVDEYFPLPERVAFGFQGRELLHGCHYRRCASDPTRILGCLLMFW